MTSLSTFFERDHRACDEIWSEVERAANANDAAESIARWRAFEESLRRHFSMEEEVLFPALGAATGMGEGGPIGVMKMEHQQMRGVLGQMAAAANANDLDMLIDQGDTLLMLIQQHNVKEEGILYPMAEQALDREWAALREKLESY